ncbi:MAG: hypothetical protein ACYTGQ_14255 [Planctomycetota bacterium]|jgi:hypothetical protein
MSNTNEQIEQTFNEASRFIGPEDVCVGDFITVTDCIHQISPFERMDTRDREVDPIRVEMMSRMAGWPLKVVAVSLPYVAIIDADGDHFSLDFRRHRLARVARSYGKALFKSVRAERKRRNK